MQLLLNLIFRIIGGERLEKGTPGNTALFLTMFAALPAGFLLWILTEDHWKPSLKYLLGHHPWGIPVCVAICCFPFITIVIWSSQIFINHPKLILMTGISLWAYLAWSRILV